MPHTSLLYTPPGLPIAFIGLNNTEDNAKATTCRYQTSEPTTMGKYWLAIALFVMLAGAAYAGEYYELLGSKWFTECLPNKDFYNKDFLIKILFAEFL